MSKLVEKLRHIPWSELGVELVIVYGSAVRREQPHDIDVLVFVPPNVDAEDVAVKVMGLIEMVTGLEADVYTVTDEADVNCFLLLEAARGLIVCHTLKGRETN